MKKYAEYQALWTDIEKHVSCSKENCSSILSHFSRRMVNKNEYIVMQGQHIPMNFFIIKGCVKAVHFDSHDKEHAIYFAMEGHWISDYHAFWNQEVSSFSILSIEKCELLSISLESQRMLCKALKEMESYFTAKSNKLIIDQQQRIMSMLKDGPIERLDIAKLLYPEIYNRIPQHLIASYLGVSRETLNRYLSTGTIKKYKPKSIVE